VSFWGAHGIAIVATFWLLALLVGVAAELVIAIGVPPMIFAIRCYVVELHYRRRR
jgi:hypothetical protein